MKYPFLFTLISGIAVFSSCEKQDIPDASGRRLKMMKMTSKGHSSVFFTNYRYDSKNRLIAQEDSGSNGILFKLYFEYNDQDHLVKTTVNDTDESGNVFQTHVVTYTYDGSGKITGSKTTFPLTAAAYIYDRSYTYDAEGRLVSDTQTVDNVPELKSYNKYIYDGNGNLTEIYDFLHDNTLARKRKLKYGTAVNIYYQLGQSYFFCTRDMLALSRHNVTEIVTVDGDPGTDSYFEYQFNSNGLPTNIKSGSDPNLTKYVNIELFYE